MKWKLSQNCFLGLQAAAVAAVAVAVVVAVAWK